MMKTENTNHKLGKNISAREENNFIITFLFPFTENSSRKIGGKKKFMWFRFSQRCKYNLVKHFFYSLFSPALCSMIHLLLLYHLAFVEEFLRSIEMILAEMENFLFWVLSIQFRHVL